MTKSKLGEETVGKSLLDVGIGVIAGASLTDLVRRLSAETFNNITNLPWYGSLLLLGVAIGLFSIRHIKTNEKKTEKIPMEMKEIE